MSNFSSSVAVGIGTAAVTAAVAASYILSSKPKPFQYPVDLNNQSVELEDGIRVSTFHKQKLLVEILFEKEEERTLYHAFQKGLKAAGGDGPCLGTRCGNKYEWMSYQQVLDTSKAFGSGLIKLGIQPGKQNFIGIYSNNRPEWIYTENACNQYSMVTVPLYDTLGPDACCFIVNHTEMTTVVCDTAAKVEFLLEKTKQMPSLKNVIVMEEISKKCTELAAKCGIVLLSFKSIVEQGKKEPKEPVIPKPSDLAVICYTSGTTGTPKGAMITHDNMIYNICSLYKHLRVTFELTPEDIHVSYLPLAHLFERLAQVMFFIAGCKIGFFSGDIKALVDDIQILKPTIFLTVPRLLNRLYDAVINGVADSKIKKWLFEKALRSKYDEIQNGILRRDSIWDKLVFHKVQNRLGGRIRLIITGSAPLSEDVLNFVRCAFGCWVYEGYGQTESTSGTTFNLPGEHSAGNVGPPVESNKVKLIDVPEMEYFAKDGKGEICVHGRNVFKGYWKQPELTAEAIDKDGWLHSGDIAMWLPNGTLKIIDRKKNIMKLAQGEYVAVEKVENVYMRSPFVAQAFVDGNSLEAYLMAIIVPDEDVLIKWAKEKNGMTTKMSELRQNNEVKNMIFKEIRQEGLKAGLKSFEQVKDIHIHSEPFSLENDLLTPTMKNKRPVLRKYFSQQISDLYKANRPI